MPTDLEALPPPPEVWSTFSPDAPADAKRESFQNRRRLKEETIEMGVETSCELNPLKSKSKPGQPAQESERTPKSSQPASKVGKYEKGVSLAECFDILDLDF